MKIDINAINRLLDLKERDLSPSQRKAVEELIEMKFNPPAVIECPPEPRRWLGITFANGVVSIDGMLPEAGVNVMVNEILPDCPVLKAHLALGGVQISPESGDSQRGFLGDPEVSEAQVLKEDMAWICMASQNTGGNTALEAIHQVTRKHFPKTTAAENEKFPENHLTPEFDDAMNRMPPTTESSPVSSSLTSGLNPLSSAEVDSAVKQMIPKISEANSENHYGSAEIVTNGEKSYETVTIYPPPESESLTLEAGKYYENRRGEVVGPLVAMEGPTTPFAFTCGWDTWTKEGRWGLNTGPTFPKDLIRAVPAPVAEQTSPFMFEVGQSYETQAGDTVEVLERSTDKGYESLRCNDGRWRYDRSTESSDAGRCTGTAHDYSYPHNFKRADKTAPVAGGDFPPVGARLRFTKANFCYAEAPIGFEVTVIKSFDDSFQTTTDRPEDNDCWIFHRSTWRDGLEVVPSIPDLTQLHEKGREAWKDVPDATAWVDEQRGNGGDPEESRAKAALPEIQVKAMGQVYIASDGERSAIGATSGDARQAVVEAQGTEAPEETKAKAALEDGWIWYGRGPLKANAFHPESLNVRWWNNEEWLQGLSGVNDHGFYALRAGSPIAIANGLSPALQDAWLPMDTAPRDGTVIRLLSEVETKGHFVYRTGHPAGGPDFRDVFVDEEQGFPLQDSTGWKPIVEPAKETPESMQVEEEGHTEWDGEPYEENGVWWRKLGPKVVIREGDEVNVSGKKWVSAKASLGRTIEQEHLHGARRRVGTERGEDLVSILERIRYEKPNYSSPEVYVATIRAFAKSALAALKQATKGEE